MTAADSSSYWFTAVALASHYSSALLTTTRLTMATSTEMKSLPASVTSLLKKYVAQSARRRSERCAQ